MQFQLNSNGDTYGTMYLQLVALRNASAAMSNALLYPHGRNYQTCEDPMTAHQSDIEEWKEARMALQNIEAYITSFESAMIKARCA